MMWSGTVIHKQVLELLYWGRKTSSDISAVARIADGIEELVGNTPLMRIRSLSEVTGCQVINRLAARVPFTMGFHQWPFRHAIGTHQFQTSGPTEPLSRVDGMLCGGRPGRCS